MGRGFGSRAVSLQPGRTRLNAASRAASLLRPFHSARASPRRRQRLAGDGPCTAGRNASGAKSKRTGLVCTTACAGRSRSRQLSRSRSQRKCTAGFCSTRVIASCSAAAASQDCRSLKVPSRCTVTAPIVVAVIRSKTYMLLPRYHRLAHVSSNYTSMRRGPPSSLSLRNNSLHRGRRILPIRRRRDQWESRAGRTVAG